MDLDGKQPERGDRLHFPKTTYVVLSSRKVKRRDPAAGPRYSILAVEDLELRVRAPRLYEKLKTGANFGYECTWNPRKKKRTLEQLIRGKS
jgi:hypothetical protein